ncbi:PTS ascorbate transporter subunit IIC [Mycoplasmopsis synoviae]|uniref:PTS ascorbate transporter subunit IIC n=1 Tax=Mycoplasmopsis synoviae TaxID=2109 RepID=UPI000CA1B535|nr:PTS ascorbate transporter subunit IIC [Mycoplasmopsis synoviae]AKJ20951.1 Ascorbate-specific PTS system, EIIC component [Mycoplasmopsis synoviae]AQU48286.1 Ascorbate-specific PTS system, EIIC component [Mycoplasmopsis synoviae]UZF64353.1 PTS ascorbate transporter subunit IIC [Mycoplasmopsis synoviae]UZF65024.1 PTS ascorbate transporter subunit IIC [Mycoplasmopsis synoviae]UZF65696.1 PTS ascorbate transporter subunit IIC [Mycoplasmopsis synoviae]
MKKKINVKALIGLIAVLVVFFLTAGITYAVRMGAYNDSFGAATTFFVDNVLIGNFMGSVTILIGTVVFAGYLILGRSFTDSFSGMLKAMIGVIMLKIGAGTLIGLARPIFSAISKLGTSVVPLDPYFVWNDSAAWLKNLNAGYEAWIAYAMLLGFFVNIVMVMLRKYTNTHSIMLTGHVMFQQSAVVVPIVYFLLFYTQGLEVNSGQIFGIIIISSLLLGLYWSVGSSATIKGSDAITGNAGFCVGHQQMLGLSIAYGIGRFFGRKEDSAETKKISNKIKIFEDNIFTQTILIFILFLVLILIAQFSSLPSNDPNTVNTIRFVNSDGAINPVYSQWNVDAKFWVINILLGSMKIVASILVLQAGVRMFVTELQQSFQGISEKLVSGSVVAVDVAATYGFSMNSVTYGFASGTIAQFVAVGILIGISKGTNGNFPIVIPLFITLFFNSGSIGVFANASGGYKASIIVPAIFGFLEIFIIAFGIFALKSHAVAINSADSLPFRTGFLGMFDWNFFFGLSLGVGSWAKSLAIIVFAIVLPLALVFVSQIVDSNRQYKKTYLQKLFKINVNLLKTQENAA